jgi:hypothetical protein
MESPPADSPPLLLPWDAAAAALAADCKADSPILTGTTTGELLLAAESNDGALLLDVGLAVDDGNIDRGSDPTPDVSPKRCPAVDKNGANGNNDESDAPLRPLS